MLLIGDIHIYPRYTDQTIQMLRDYITSHADETDIIFVGDYVYHFSYHKPSLLALLDLWIDIAHSGKTLYILAGNHDRLGQHFVYAEAEKIISHHNQSSNIHFITTPQTHTIGGETIIFLPYMIQRSEYTPQSDSYDFPLHLDVCKDSTHNSTKTSYLLNTCIADMITKERKSDTNKELILIHHYYTAERVFPGLKTKFGYKDIALSPHRLEEKNLRIISGHIHHSFVDQNYLCL